MATTPTPTPQLTDEQMAALLERVTQAPSDSATPAAPAKLKYRLGTQSFEASTPEELQQQLDAAMGQVTQVVQGLQAQVAKPVTPAEPAAAAPAFNKERYAELFLSDPVAAQDYLDEFRFGIPQPTRVIKASLQSQQNVEQSLAVQAFLGDAEDYVATPENFAALAATMSDIGAPWTARGMKAAFALAKSEGRIRVSDQDEGGGSPLPVTTRRMAPSVPRGAQQASSAVEQGMMDRFESLNPDQMKAFLMNLPGA